MEFDPLFFDPSRFLKYQVPEPQKSGKVAHPAFSLIPFLHPQLGRGKKIRKPLAAIYGQFK